MVSKEEFDIFKKALLSQKDKLTFDKSEKKRKLIQYLVVGGEIAIAIFLMTFFLVGKSGFSNISGGFIVTTTIIFLVTVVTLTLAIFKFISSKKLNEIKKDKLPQILQFLIGDRLSYFSTDEFLSKEEFKSAGFAGHFDTFSGEDLIEIDIPKDDGTKSGVAFKACDLNVTETVVDSDGNSSTKTVYFGAFCAVHFPFEFKCRLAINSRLSGVKKFKLEDVSFNKAFQVFSDNQVEALCILTPSMMQKLVKLKEKTKTVKITIFDNHLYLGFPGFNFLELGSAKQGLSDKIFEDIYSDVELLLAIVEEIKTNNRIFKI